MIKEPDKVPVYVPPADQALEIVNLLNLVALSRGYPKLKPLYDEAGLALESLCDAARDRFAKYTDLNNKRNAEIARLKAEDDAKMAAAAEAAKPKLQAAPPPSNPGRLPTVGEGANG